MDISSALNRIEVVLNQYRAFVEVEEALKIAANAERIVVDLGLKADALKKAIDDLEVSHDSILADVDAAKVKSDEEVKKAAADLKAQYDAWGAKITAAAVEYDSIIDRIASARDEHQVDMERRRREIDAIQADADVEEARLKTVRQAIDSLKAVL